MNNKSKKSESNRAPKHRSTEAPLYRLRKGLGSWELVFEGRRATLKHEKGLAYVAYLLLNPPTEPIHALDLAAAVSPAKGAYISEIVDPETGQKAYLEKHSRLQERSLALDEALTMRAVIRQQNDLEALVERQGTIEPVKEEAWRELEALYNYETKRSERVRGNAQRAVRAVRMAIKRFFKRLQEARDADGQPIPVLLSFAEHLQRYLLIPSAMCSLAAGLRTHSGFPGCFIYQPPAALAWEK